MRKMLILIYAENIINKKGFLRVPAKPVLRFSAFLNI